MNIFDRVRLTAKNNTKSRALVKPLIITQSDYTAQEGCGVDQKLAGAARLSSLLGQPPPRVCGGWSARLHTITPLIITGISFSPDV